MGASLCCLAVLGVGACGGDEARTPPPPKPIPESEVERPPKNDIVVIVVKDTVSGGGRQVAKLGKTVRIQVIADRTDTVRVSGYEKEAAVAKGKPATIAFTADVAGKYTVDLVSAKKTLVNLVVK